MVEQNAQGAGEKEASHRIVSDKFKMVDKPLDFSFLKLDNINSLIKEPQRSGTRKPIPEDEDEEDTKKNENLPAAAETDKHEEAKEKDKERIIKAPQTNEIQKILTNNNISLMTNKNNFASNKRSEDAKVETKKKIVITKETQILFL